MSILSSTLVLINEISSRKNEKSRLLISKAHLLFNFQGKNRWPVRKESLALPKSPKKRGHNARISILSPILMAGAPTPSSFRIQMLTNTDDPSTMVSLYQ